MMLLTGSVLFATLLVQDDEGFTTGPPPVLSDRQGPPRAPILDDLLIDRRGGTDGTDIPVNQVTSNAQNETAIAINPNDEDNWVAVANDYRTGNVETGWYTTLDGGQSWTTGTFGVRSGFSFSGDPCVTFTPDGNVHVVCMQYGGPGGNEVRSYRSEDGGLTWNNGRSVDLDGSNDKPQVDSDHSNGPHRGDITTAWDRFGSTPDIYVSTSSNGLVYSPSQQINGANSQNGISPDVAYGADSRLYVMWADRGTFDLWVDVSTDGGATWGQDVLVDSYTPLPFSIPGSTFRNFDIFAMAADWTDGPHSGNVYIARAEWRAGGESDILCHRSTDGGATWVRNQVHTDPGRADQFFPGIDTDPQGNVHVSYYDRRNDPNNFLIWTWISRSCDGGASWKESQVSDTAWDHTNTEFGGSFIGDYCDVESSAHRVLPFWVDGRTGTQDVYTDSLSLDLSTDVDTLSAATGGAAEFQIDIGPNHAGDTYFLLGSFSGTDPGFSVGGLQVPLNYDLLTLFTITQANNAVFQDFRGTLDACGSARARLDTQGPFNPNVAGLDLDFAALIQDSGSFVFVSNPTRVGLVN